MDRQTVYPGQILPETVLLQMTKDAMIGLAKISAFTLGTGTIANGFAVTPTGPASLQVVVAAGEIYAPVVIDATAFSSLPADTTHTILKQGIMLDSTTVSCPAPTTTGQSINYLVEVAYQDLDSAPVLLPYYNSANPAMPYSGMGNNGLTQNTSRKGAAVIQVKPGASAATGSQVTPAPDSGYVGLYVVSVANGQTTITSANITQYSGAPLLPSGIVQSIQSGNMSFAIDTGTAGAYVGAFSPAFTARTEGQIIRLKAKNANPGASTINDGVSTVALVGGAHAALQGGEIVANGDMWAQWNSSVGTGSYILLFCTGAPEQIAPATQSGHAVNAAQIQAQSLTAFATGGTAPAFTLTPVPAITAYVANQRFQVTFNAAGTTPTLNVSGLGAKNLKQYTSSGSKIAAIVASGQTSDVVYDGTDLVVLDQLPNSVGATPAQFDNSTNLATTQFVQGVGLQFSSLVLASASMTLTAAAHAGALIVGNSSSAINLTLPAVSSMPAKTVIKFWNFNSGPITLICAGSDGLYSPGGGTSFTLQTGSYLTIAGNGTAAWFAIENSTQGVTPAQFNGSTALATTAFVQGVGLQFSGIFTPTANTTLTAATHAGAVIIANSASLLTITLPASSTMPSKTAIKLWSYGAGGMTVTAAGSDSIYLPATNTTVAVPQGAWITLVSNGANGWYAVDMSGFGIGQTYQNVTSTRVIGTSYPNATGRVIEVCYTGYSGSGGSLMTAVVAGNTIQSVPMTSATTNYSVSFRVLPGQTYAVTQSSGTILSWWEIR